MEVGNLSRSSKSEWAKSVSLNCSKALAIRRIFFIFSVCMMLSVHAQDQNRKHSIGLYQVFTDYNVSLLDGSVLALDSSLSLSTRIGYQNRLSKSWYFTLGYANGFVNNVTLRSIPITKSWVSSLDASIQLALNNGYFLPQSSLIGPYLSFGYRVDRIRELNSQGLNPYLGHNQYGLGVNISLSDRTHIQLQASVDQKLADDFNTHMRYRFGVTQSIGRLDNKYKALFDSDRDGTLDEDDLCPALFGLPELQGCPDTTCELLVDSLIDQTVLLQDSIAAIKQSVLTWKLQRDSLERIKDSLLAYSDSLSNSVEQVVDTSDEEPSEELIIPQYQGYYIIIVSVRDLGVATRYEREALKHYKDVEIMKLDNGFYRVGIRAGNSLSSAKTLLDDVKSKGFDPVWITRR